MQDGSELNGEPEVVEALDKAAGGGGLVSSVEVVGAEILVERALEHGIDGAQEGGTAPIAFSPPRRAMMRWNWT